MTNKIKKITYFSLFLQVLVGCIYPDMCIAYIFGFVWLHFSGHVVLSSLVQGFIHDDHEDLINKHVMMIRVTDNI